MNQTTSINGEKNRWQLIQGAFEANVEQKKNQTFFEAFSEGFHTDLGLGEGVAKGALQTLEQGLPFRENLVEGYQALRNPEKYADHINQRSNRFRNFFRSVWEKPGEVFKKLKEKTLDVFTQKTVWFLNASPRERAKKAGELVVPLTLAAMTPEIPGMHGVDIPHSFGSLRRFNKMTRLIRTALQDENAIVGVRGSAATGVRFRGGLFCWKSDFDFFVASDKWFKKGLQRGASPYKGAFNVGATKNFFPELHMVERTLKDQLVRKSWIRVFSQKGFKRIQTGREILQKQP